MNLFYSFGSQWGRGLSVLSPASGLCSDNQMLTVRWGNTEKWNKDETVSLTIIASVHDGAVSIIIKQK